MLPALVCELAVNTRPPTRNLWQGTKEGRAASGVWRQNRATRGQQQQARRLARGEHEVLLREAVALWEVSNEYRITR